LTKKLNDSKLLVFYLSEAVIFLAVE